MSRSLRPQIEPPTENPDLRALLGESQLTVLRRYGAAEPVVDGEILFADGDQTYDMIVVLEGAFEIVEHYGRPDEVAGGSNYGAAPDAVTSDAATPRPLSTRRDTPCKPGTR